MGWGAMRPLAAALLLGHAVPTPLLPREPVNACDFGALGNCSRGTTPSTLTDVACTGACSVGHYWRVLRETSTLADRLPFTHDCARDSPQPRALLGAAPRARRSRSRISNTLEIPGESSGTCRA